MAAPAWAREWWVGGGSSGKNIGGNGIGKNDGVVVTIMVVTARARVVGVVVRLWVVTT